MRDTVWLNGDGTLGYIDQRLLPQEEVCMSAGTAEEVYSAIKTLAVRGAPAIGVGAAIGIYAAAQKLETEKCEDFVNKLTEIANYIASARPTAVNLSWAARRMVNAAKESPKADVRTLKLILKRECESIRDEDIAACRAIGENGLKLLKDGMTVLTHCNAGALAAVRYGTALAPIHLGREKGINIKVYADETRPLLQGARLTAYELAKDGVDVTLITDGMGASLMAEGRIDAVLVGCDRATARGDAANKIGTLAVATAAKYFGVPFYVCLPMSTVDTSIISGDGIVIEARSEDEVTKLHYKKDMSISGVKVYNPAFDVTPAELITAFITEKGIFRPEELAHVACMQDKSTVEELK